MVVRQFEHSPPTTERSPLSEIPATCLESHPWRMYIIGAAFLAQRRPAEAATWLHRLSRPAADAAGARFLECRVEMLWAVHDALRGDAAGVLHHQQRVDEDLEIPQDQPPVGPSCGLADPMCLRPLHAAVADRFRLAVAWARLTRSEAGRARTALDAFVSGGGSPDDFAYLSLRAAGAYLEGRLREACTLAQRLLPMAHVKQGADTLYSMAPHVTLAAVLRERNQLRHAEAYLTEALTICEQRDAREEAVEVRCELIRLMVAQSRYEEALEEVERLACLDDEAPLPERLHRKLQRTEVACRLAMRDIDGSELAMRSLPSSSRPPEMMARLDLLRGRPDRAEHTLKAVRESASPMRARIEQLVLLARADLLLGRQDRARGTLRRALELGRPEHYIRVFVEDAPALATLLLDIAGAHSDAFLAELAAIVAKTRPVTPKACTTPVGQPAEPLTKRERDVLSLLPSHLTQRRIGAALYLSHNTIKSHTKSLYRKLGAASRSEAIQTAMYHGLL